MPESNKNDYKYYAFISYSRKNEKIAKWLQKKLETYRLPAVLQKQNSSLPKKLKVFRDQTDISVGGTVEHALSRELQDSKKLIVLCSPDSAKSDYVEYEVASFLKLGRSTDDILPFVVDGKIDADSLDHCYTPLLTSLNLNAADAVQEGKKNAFIRLLASLLGIKYDDLKRREHVRTVKRILVFIFCIILLISVFCVYMISFQVATIRYFKGYVRLNGVFTGLNEINKKTAAKRMSSIRITSKGCFGKPIQLDIIDGAGNPSRINRITAIVSNSNKENSVWATTIKLNYDQNGKLLEELVVDSDGNVYLDFHYINENLAAYIENGFVTPQSMEGASYVKFVRDKRGFETESYFFDNRNLPAMDNKGAYGIKQTYSSDFTEIKTTSIDENGNPILNNEGYVSLRTLRKENGDSVRLEYLGFKDELVCSELGYAAVEVENDEFGNEIKYTFLDENGKVCHNDNVVSAILFHCNEGIFISKEYAFFKETGTMELIEVDDISRPIVIKTLDEKKQEITKIVYAYNEDDTYSKKVYYAGNDSPNTISYYNKHNKILPYLSNYICIVTQLADAGSKDFLDIQLGDIILELGSFSYFNNSALDFSSNEDVGSNSRAIFYRPSTQQIFSFTYKVLPNLSARAELPCKNMEENIAYISHIKSAYEDWLKSQ